MSYKNQCGTNNIITKNLTFPVTDFLYLSENENHKDMQKYFLKSNAIKVKLGIHLLPSLKLKYSTFCLLNVICSLI